MVPDATLGGQMPRVLGASATTVFWSASSGATTLVGGVLLASLPVQGTQLATGIGPVAAMGDRVAFVSDRSVISLVDSAGVVQRVTDGSPETVGGSATAIPVVAWTVGSTVSWGVDANQQSVMLNKVTNCDHVRVTSEQIYLAVDGSGGRGLIRVEQRTGRIVPTSSSVSWATKFPGGATAGATYRGRIVAADDDGALWLVEEMPSGRGIVVSEPVVGEASVLLEHVSHAAGFFASADTLYWQEGDELLSAPRTGGAASIIATLPGAAGAFADGYVYFTHGTAIERLRVE